MTDSPSNLDFHQILTAWRESHREGMKRAAQAMGETDRLRGLSVPGDRLEPNEAARAAAIDSLLAVDRHLWDACASVLKAMTRLQEVIEALPPRIDANADSDNGESS